MSKLSKSELGVLTDVIYQEVRKQRLEKVRKNVEGREDFKKLREDVKEFDKKREELQEEWRELAESVDKIKEELCLGYNEDSDANIRLTGGAYFHHPIQLCVEEGYLSKDSISRRLVLENLGKDIDVDTLIDKLTKLFVNY